MEEALASQPRAAESLGRQRLRKSGVQDGLETREKNLFRISEIKISK